jgi:hypothetical protein
LKERFPACEAWQISATGTKNYIGDLGVRACHASVLLKTLI